MTTTPYTSARNMHEDLTARGLHDDPDSTPCELCMTTTLTKGHLYDMTINGTAFRGVKVTSTPNGYYRLKIRGQSWGGRVLWSYLVVAPDQISNLVECTE